MKEPQWTPPESSAFNYPYHAVRALKVIGGTLILIAFELLVLIGLLAALGLSQ